MTKPISPKAKLFSAVTPRRSDWLVVIMTPIASVVAAFVAALVTGNIASSVHPPQPGGYIDLNGLPEALITAMAVVILLPVAFLSARFRWRGVGMAAIALVGIVAVWKICSALGMSESGVTGWVVVLAVIPCYAISYLMLRKSSR